ncbi:hypothetical protein VCHA51O444_10478 [Vibrio chagasii]|nr:hypothetical protein VCHA51O444_10478 [Vibrio chagasii]CAH7345436.1 hypothetical protein VCHA53O474_30285 [Vibrio chagasii]
MPKLYLYDDHPSHIGLLASDALFIPSCKLLLGECREQFFRLLLRKCCHLQLLFCGFFKRPTAPLHAPRNIR